MIYQVTIDGVKKQIEVQLNDTTRKADNEARKKIIDHYLDEEGAHNVTIESARIDNE